MVEDAPDEISSSFCRFPPQHSEAHLYLSDPGWQRRPVKNRASYPFNVHFRATYLARGVTFESICASYHAQVSENPNEILLEEAKAGRVLGLETILGELGSTASVNGALDRSFQSPLCLACRGGHAEAALFLLRRAGADPNNARAEAAAAAAAAVAVQGYDGGAVDEGAGGSGDGGPGAPLTPLALAVDNGLDQVVEELLARGARVDARRAGDGWTALHLCAARGNALIMEALLAAPLADAGVRTARLETPLSVASFHGHLSVVDMLLGQDDDDAGAADDDGANKAAAGGRTSAALVETAPAESDGGGAEGGRRGRRRGSDRFAQDKTWAGRTPLHRAAGKGHVEVVLRLLHHGVAVDPTDSQGATPLHLAARGGHFQAARALVREGGASASLATADGDTPLHASCSSGREGQSAGRVVQLLLDSGAEVDAQNRLGSTGANTYRVGEVLSRMRGARSPAGMRRALFEDGARAGVHMSCDAAIYLSFVGWHHKTANPTLMLP